MFGAMEVALLSSTATTSISINLKFSHEVQLTPFNISSSFSLATKFQKSKKNYSCPYTISSSLFSNNNISSFSSSISSVSLSTITSATSTTTTAPIFFSSSPVSNQRHWMVIMDTPPKGLNSKSVIIDYYVKSLERVLGSEEDAQMCIYDASCESHFGFCCDIDEEISRELACLPGVLSVRPDPDFNSMKKDYSYSNVQSNPPSRSSNGNYLLFPLKNSKNWLVRIDKPAIGVISKPQVIDYCVQILANVLGNEKDAQMCMYNISWKSNVGFCCELDDESALELAGVPGVLSVQLGEKFESDNKDYGGENLQQSSNFPNSSAADQSTNIGTKKLFVTGLSFYTSEKTLRAAFEGFGVLVEVRIIMDKISKRSRGYAFIEYTTEQAASAALKEMNGKIINGWMIVVDAAKKTPTRYGRGHPRPAI